MYVHRSNVVVQIGTDLVAEYFVWWYIAASRFLTLDSGFP
jgi:hypothetical protein